MKCSVEDTPNTYTLLGRICVTFLVVQFFSWVMSMSHYRGGDPILLPAIFAVSVFQSAKEVKLSILENVILRNTSYKYCRYCRR